MSVNSSSRARRRGSRRSARSGRGRRLTLAGRGDGWELWVPEDDWRGLSDSERARLVEGQAALLEPSPAHSKTRPPGRVAGAPDQMTTAGPSQLNLFGGGA